MATAELLSMNDKRGGDKQKALDSALAQIERQFGKGSIKGLAAPEAANNAACTGSFVPLLTLGIPGSGTRGLHVL